MAKLYLGTQEVSSVLKKTNVQELTVTPTTTSQTAVAPEGTGYSPVNVSAVTSAIDSNITAGNIKKDVTILGVTGSYEPNISPISITPTTSSQTIVAPSGIDGYSPINVSAVTSAIDSNITAGNIKKDVTILGVTGTYEPPPPKTGLLREVSAQGVFGVPTSTSSFSLPSTATNIGDYSMYYAFSQSAGIVSADLSSVISINGINAMAWAFQGCSNLSSVDLSNLVTVGGNGALSQAFQNCTSLTSVSLPNLTTISNNNGMYAAFYRSSITSVSLPKLSSLTGSYALRLAFGGTSISSISFPALTSGSFGSNTNQFYQMLYTCSGVTVHFPSSIRSTIGSWSDVTGGFGGTNTTVLYDL